MSNDQHKIKREKTPIETNRSTAKLSVFRPIIKTFVYNPTNKILYIVNILFVLKRYFC